MRTLLATLAVAAAITALPAPSHAQTVLDHRVQRAWDSLVSPPPPGDPRTNWERHHDQRRAEHYARFCHYHPRSPDCYRR